MSNIQSRIDFLKARMQRVTKSQEIAEKQKEKLKIALKEVDIVDPTLKRGLLDSQSYNEIIISQMKEWQRQDQQMIDELTTELNHGHIQ